MITRPTLLLDKGKCIANIEKMVRKAQENNIVFRPHFKTHQSSEIGEWFKQLDIECITVSSVKMAEYFAANGWKDITIAFPSNILEWENINQLATKININLVVESIETIKFLEEKINSPIGIYIKVDTGYGRTGVKADDFVTIKQLLNSLKTCKNLIFIGYLCHTGHTYNTRSKKEIEAINKSASEQLLALKTFMASDFPLAEISFGDTPSCSVLNDFGDYNEIRPGNFVFYDETQYKIGSCNRNEIAVALASPIVAKHPERNEIVVHGGAVHLSKDTIKDENDKNYYGIAVELNNNGWDTDKVVGTVTKISQEHGIITVEDSVMNRINVGDLVAILPIHSCLTANLMKEYLTTEGKKITMML
ncbi:alanine racemase [Carboxylicivirga caseinilyticus]|uniref:alanine racemase n=1 Tax=Carboxylicivirga caseinilyticus TaxID=3417572 RepID=UPI003D32B003|nr:alanine racemase [Marinilabiliaceae bacterium A049]